jgi:hypothetical protein
MKNSAAEKPAHCTFGHGLAEIVAPNRPIAKRVPEDNNAA